MTSMIGRTIGGYYVEQLLGTGGMGEVYRGYNVHTKHPVAIKIINAKWTADSSIKARFVREAKIVAQLDHPHIVRMRHFDEVDGCLYLVMDFVTDGSLRSLLARYKAKKQPFPLDVGLDLARQSTDALFYAHTQGVIHRDVKPENILLQPESSPSSTLPPYVVKLSDFGLARIAETGSFLTVPGMVMGTPAYMSPEQCLGKTVDERADIYALGVVLYEMTTGYLPFNGSLEKLFEQHLNVPPQPLRTIRTDLPEQIEAIVLRCLAKDPEDRFTSAAALSQALTDARASLSAPIPLQETFSGTTAPSQTRQIGNYFVESEHPIGSGGMGQVFRARDLRDSRQVALKIIYDNLAANPKVRERFFKRELSIAQRLRHPNIVEVFDGGEDGRQLFLAMEWMADGSLRTLLDQRTVTPLPLILGLALVAQAADALAYAHSQGVVHRDIKPENLLLRVVVQ
jgi:serine/threonine protein kinase